MKRNLVFGVVAVVLFVGQAVWAEETSTVQCSEITGISYRIDDGGPNRYVTAIQTNNNRVYSKWFNTSDGLMKASQLANDLRNCNFLVVFHTLNRRVASEEYHNVSKLTVKLR
ncbi:MAG TPA: hypothetical protein VJB34_02125 [Bdellovibrionota bacterium]|nr:hypothetical protein [Bdellovibrionota bacterium]